VGRAYIDGRRINSTPGLGIGDHWLAQVRDQLHKVGVPLIYDDTPEIFPNGIDDGLRSVLRMVTDKIAGPFHQPDFQFVPGAVASTFHSFKREHSSTMRTQAGPAPAEQGAAATIGNVYEPYLQLTGTSMS